MNQLTLYTYWWYLSIIVASYWCTVKGDILKACEEKNAFEYLSMIQLTSAGDVAELQHYGAEYVSVSKGV